MEEPDRREANGDATQDPNGQEEHEQADSSPENNPALNDPTEGSPPIEALAKDAGSDGAAAEDAEGDQVGGEVADLERLRDRLEAKDRHIRELYEEIAAASLAADEARTRAAAVGLRAGDLEEERVELKERLRAVEKEERKRWRRREGQDRRVARLEREIERREAEIERLQDLLEGRKSEIEAYEGEFQDTLSRKDVALEDALRRVEGLQHDLEERENEVVELRATIDKLRAELDLEYELRRRIAEPANRLREGIDLFNGSEHLQTVNSISKSLGQPKVLVALETGDSSPVILTFVWEDITWRTYHANPGLAVREPRVYLESSGEGPTNMGGRPSNAHIGSDGRVVLGL